MASKTETYYPPYEGNEPYIHLCFSGRDERKVRPLLRRLMLRGCRVWYCMDKAQERAALAERNQRMLGAGLTVLYLTNAAREDTELKNWLLLCQARQQPILILNTDGGDSGLSVGLTAGTSVSVLGGNARDACDSILHGPGFSQAFMGDPVKIKDHLWLKCVSVLLLILSLLLVVGGVVYVYLHPPVILPPEVAEPEPEDTLLLRDEALKEAVRGAIGGGPITEEAVAGLAELSFARLPEDISELALLPDLSTLILSQEAAKAAPETPELYERYTLIVAGGDGQ